MSIYWGTFKPRKMAHKRDDDAPPLWLAIALAGAGILGAGLLLILVLSF